MPAPTMTDRRSVIAEVERELSGIGDPSLLALIRRLLVEPDPVERGWNDGADGQAFARWTVLEHRPSNTGVACCGQGFGPASPWGLVRLVGPNADMGMDSDWFARLKDAVRRSPAWGGEDPPGYEVG